MIIWIIDYIYKLFILIRFHVLSILILIFLFRIISYYYSILWTCFLIFIIFLESTFIIELILNIFQLFFFFFFLMAILITLYEFFFLLKIVDIWIFILYFQIYILRWECAFQFFLILLTLYEVLEKI